MNGQLNMHLGLQDYIELVSYKLGWTLSCCVYIQDGASWGGCVLPWCVKCLHVLLLVGSLNIHLGLQCDIHNPGQIVQSILC